MIPHAHRDVPLWKLVWFNRRRWSLMGKEAEKRGNEKMAKLYLFDLDQTLIDQSTCVLLPGVSRWLESHKFDHMALCSNQGGVGLRHQMMLEKWGNPQSYPDENKVAQKLERLFSQISKTIHLSVYLCYAYQSAKTGRWSPTPEGKENDPFWNPQWRKPAPGMLLQAIKDYDCRPEEAIFVGDNDSDMNAAIAAGVSFQDANLFFKRL